MCIRDSFKVGGAGATAHIAKVVNEAVLNDIVIADDGHSTGRALSLIDI